VTVQAGHTVTLDLDVAGATNLTIAGTLSFSRAASSALTLAGGDIIVNAGGTLDMGTASAPLSASSATLILAYGRLSDNTA